MLLLGCWSCDVNGRNVWSRKGRREIEVEVMGVHVLLGV